MSIVRTGGEYPFLFKKKSFSSLNAGTHIMNTVLLYGTHTPTLLDHLILMLFLASMKLSSCQQLASKIDRGLL